MSDIRWSRPPIWFTILVVLIVLPSMSAFPLWSSETSLLPRWMTLLFPAYGLLTGALAWYIFDERPTLAWILLSLLLLSYAALCYLPA